MIIELDMYQTLAVAVVVLMLGKFLREKVQAAGKVSASLRPSWRRAVCRVHLRVLCDRHCEFTFDDILKEVCMVFSLPRSASRQT